MTNFVRFLLTGNAKSVDKLGDSGKFLQGQITANINKINDIYLPTAICNLKGRVQFGIWLKQCEKGYHIVLSADLADTFANHVKKYGAFSKVELTEKTDIYPTVIDNLPSFSDNLADKNLADWQSLSIQTGNYWINQDNTELFQPQELRLHQRAGVDYDKGCYLGQEIVARLWFRAQPKHWLHLIAGQGDCPSPATQLDKDVQVVNSVINADNEWLALVVAKPEALATLDVKVLNLPEALNGEIGRPKA